MSRRVCARVRVLEMCAAEVFDGRSLGGLVEGYINVSCLVVDGVMEWVRFVIQMFSSPTLNVV